VAAAEVEEGATFYYYNQTANVYLAEANHTFLSAKGMTRTEWPSGTRARLLIIKFSPHPNTCNNTMSDVSFRPVFVPINF
jgi:hypothetical protein